MTILAMQLGDVLQIFYALITVFTNT